MLTWCEINTNALSSNVSTLKARLPQGALIAPTVKSNGYGHGLLIAAQAFLDGGADWLCIHSIEEARRLRHGDIDCPLYLFGPLDLDDVEEAIYLGLRIVTYTQEHVEHLETLLPKMKLPQEQRVHLHLKVETGNHRQGISPQEVVKLAERITETPQLHLEGICSHFANIEDTTDHQYARQQLRIFQSTYEMLFNSPKICNALLGNHLMRHIANSAATLLWADQVMDMARVGISAYGLWPSKETLSVARFLGGPSIELTPGLSWKTKVAQVKSVAEGSSVGYGCTFTTTRASRLALIPVGYYEGYDRGLSNLAHVLIHGRRAPVRGRVCMNMMMVEVTDIPKVQIGDEVVLLGKQGEEAISAEQLATWASTINYEIIARIAGHLPRVSV